MAWRRSGDKPLSEPMMVSLPTHICVTRPQWVNQMTSVFNGLRFVSAQGRHKIIWVIFNFSTRTAWRSFSITHKSRCWCTWLVPTINVANSESVVRHCWRPATCCPATQCCCTTLRWCCRSWRHPSWRTRRVTWRRYWVLWQIWSWLTSEYH